MFKFLHAADLHLDSPLKGLERYEGAPVEMLLAAVLFEKSQTNQITGNE